MRRANGTGFVYKIDNNPNRRNPYAYGFNTGWADDGRPIRKILGYTTSRSKAKLELDKYLATDSFDILQDMTWKELYDKWYKYKKTSGVSDSGMNHYSNAFKKTSILNNIKFKDITLDAIQSIINTSGVKSDGQKRIRNLYSQLYEYARVSGINVGANFTQFILIDKEVKSTKHSPFTREEINLLWKNRDSFIDVILFMIYTGIRPNELFKIENHVDFIVTGSKTHAGLNRTIPIHNDIKCIDLIIPSKNSFYALFKEKLQQLGINHLPYDTRHTFATMWKLSRCDEFARKKIMGHSDKDLTNKVYTHIDLDFLTSELNKVAFK